MIGFERPRMSERELTITYEPNPALRAIYRLAPTATTAIARTSTASD